MDFCIAAQQRVAAAIAVAKPQPVTHWGSGSAIVERIASNRRILSSDGKTFAFQRFTACKQSPQCDAPEGLIDPRLKTYSFYNGDKRLASLHYYAVHPMSYYGKGVINSDFVGIARAALRTGEARHAAGAADALAMAALGEQVEAASDAVREARLRTVEARVRRALATGGR